ncbi:MAG: hypothetical protein FJY77_01600 [Candidatus Altiarchaeales archaeon]|nr:hypothetical protein [Candidatus Altiarchaeales archaeon]
MGKRSILWLAILLLLAGSASAGFTMHLRTMSEVVSDQQARINFSLVNAGDETAYQIFLETILPEGFTSSSVYSPSLRPNQPLSGVLDIKFPQNAVEGRYPVVIMLHYSDRNSYPFSIIFPEYIKYKEGMGSKVQLMIPTVEITGPDQVGFNLKVYNQDSKEHNLTIRLYTPKEIEANITVKDIQLTGQSNTVVENNIWSNGALYDSDYLILASVSYIEDGRVYSSIAQGRAKIVKPLGMQIGENLFKEFQWALILLILLVGVVVVFFMLREKPGGRDEKKGRPEKKARKQKAR